MTKHEIFALWAPDDSAWSPWVKPVLFAHLSEWVTPSNFDIPPVPPWLPAADGGSALVFDVPGDAGVWLGLRAAEAGYRPVPLYNGCPAPSDSLIGEQRSDMSLVDVVPILRAIVAASPRLAELRFAPDAPPAFLLDHRRRTGHFAPQPGKFDNRSISLPTDFPGASFLLSRGVRRVVLVQEHDTAPQADLAHTLRRWHEARIQIDAKQLDPDLPICPSILPRPFGFRSMWHRLMMTWGFKPNALGGFGGTLTEPSAG